MVSFSPANDPPPKLTNLVILSHPDDCARIARAHIKKMPDQALFLGDGVLSTTDNASWREQRAHFIEAFLPNASLASVYPINLKRAATSTQNLKDEVGAGGAAGVVVDMTEFLLNETMAQLQASDLLYTLCFFFLTFLVFLFSCFLVFIFIFLFFSLREDT